MRTFVDANVLFAAAYSETGTSRAVLRHAIRGHVVLVTSDLVLEEARRNLVQKAPDVVGEFRTLIRVLPLEIVNPTREEVVRAAEYTVHKDAPVVAAAVRAQVDYLVSLDRRHLVDAKNVAENAGILIVLPEVLLDVLRNRFEQQV